MKQYEFIKKSKLSECAESCYSELNETKVIPVLSDAELEEYGVREMTLFQFQIQREELDKCMDYGKFLMNCGLYQDALIMITFYM